MKILLCNKFYYRRGGADVYMLNLEELLKAKGHDVAVFAMQHPQGMASAFSEYFPSAVEYAQADVKQFIQLVTRPFGTKEVRRKFNALLNSFQPDAVHLNNIHSQLSPVIAQIAHERGIKTVWTIHDCKLLCPRYDCLRNGKEICELCFTNKIHALKNRCMKNSFPASLIAWLEALKWPAAKLEKYTDTFICPSRFITNKMTEGGLNENKLVTLCNFIDVEKTKRENCCEREDYYCYMGRLSAEKGVKTLLDAAKSLPYSLKIIGNGTLKEQLTGQASSNIEFCGYRNWDEIKDIVGKARFSVIPSECYENNPLSVIESQCLGTPVLGARIGGIPELIESGKTGILFEPRNAKDLKEKIEQMFTLDFDYQTLAEKAQKQYNAENYYTEIVKIYQQ
jgi:glycosyltransferase involved in cell wall biosynthesis